VQCESGNISGNISVSRRNLKGTLPERAGANKGSSRRRAEERRRAKRINPKATKLFKDRGRPRRGCLGSSKRERERETEGQELT
jgi:hypothetical protein